MVSRGVVTYYNANVESSILTLQSVVASVTCASFIPNIFGMNLVNGHEHADPSENMWVKVVSITLSGMFVLWVIVLSLLYLSQRNAGLF
jgi:hypothetical protein